MKLMTQNCHSLEEPDYEQKLIWFAARTAVMSPDILALQEVSQRQTSPEVSDGELEDSGYVFCKEETADGIHGAGVIPVCRDNHAFRLAGLLKKHGWKGGWIWTPIKLGYEKYDEGLAIFTRYPVLEAEAVYLTGSRDYHNWKVRKALRARVGTETGIQDIYSLHMGWWTDEDEPFTGQWERLGRYLSRHTDVGQNCQEAGQNCQEAGWECQEADQNCQEAGWDCQKAGQDCSRGGSYPGNFGHRIWLMGDFNAPAETRGESYDRIRECGWLDTYLLAEKKDDGITVDHRIDGWKDKKIDRKTDKKTDKKTAGMRMDHIWTNRPVPVLSSQVVFDGRRQPLISDHFGVLVETGI